MLISNILRNSCLKLVQKYFFSALVTVHNISLQTSSWYWWLNKDNNIIALQSRSA